MRDSRLHDIAAWGASTTIHKVRGHPGRWLITAAALAAPIGAITADWNDTHVFNPAWPPHAKFHNAQTILAAAGFAAASLWELWRPRAPSRGHLRQGTVLASAYWLTQLGALAFPGTALSDPPGGTRRWRNQITGQLLVIWPALGIGYLLER